jgi:hypothetical protein
MKNIKNIFSVFATLFVLFFVVNITAQNNQKNMLNSIKNEIAKFFNSSINDILINGELPDFKLYDIEIVNISTNMDKIDFNVKISDFFDKTKYKIVYATLKNKSINNIAPDSKVKVFYKKNNITLITDGNIEKIENNNFVIVKTTYGKKLKCRVIDKNSVEVAE